MFARLAAFIALVLIACAPALAAEKRLALVLSNQDYPASVGKLSNTHSDGDTVAAALTDSGFAVTRRKDLNSADMDDALTDFEKAINAEAADGDEVVAFFYASMHGAAADVEGRTRNFLLPAKEDITTTGQLIRKGMRLDLLIQSLGSTDAKAVVIVSDACRNTMAASFRKGGDKGFVTERAGPGMLIAYATEAGFTTPDDGLFARTLTTKIRQTGTKAAYAILDTLAEVGRQRSWDGQPFMTGGLPDWLCFNGCAAAAGGYDLARLHPDVRKAVEAARAMKDKAERAAATAREANTKGEDAARRARRGEAGYGTKNYDYAGGVIFRGQMADGKRNGYGVVEADTSEYTYSGQFKNDEHTGYAVNYGGPDSAFEGLWSKGQKILGVQRVTDPQLVIWGESPAGGSFPSGSSVIDIGTARYEGGYANGMLNGYGALWDSKGVLAKQGLWKDNELAQALEPQNKP